MRGLAVFAIGVGLAALLAAGLLYGVMSASVGGCVQTVGSWSGPCSATAPASVSRAPVLRWRSPGGR